MSTVDLTAADRCDRCGSRAYVLVSVFVPESGDRELLFCAHDYRQHESQLLGSGVQVLLDQRRQLEYGSEPRLAERETAQIDPRTLS